MWKKQDSSTDRACRRPSSKDGLRHQSTLVVLVVFFIFFTVTFLVLTVFFCRFVVFLWYSRFDGLLAFLVTVKYDDDDGDDFKHKSDVTLVARARFHSPERCR